MVNWVSKESCQWLYVVVLGGRCIQQTSRLMMGVAGGDRKYAKRPSIVFALRIMICLREQLRCNKSP